MDGDTVGSGTSLESLAAGIYLPGSMVGGWPAVDVVVLVLVMTLASSSLGSESAFTFALRAGGTDCYYETAGIGARLEVEFQVGIICAEAKVEKKNGYAKKEKCSKERKKGKEKKRPKGSRQDDLG